VVIVLGVIVLFHPGLDCDLLLGVCDDDGAVLKVATEANLSHEDPLIVGCWR
jgi:hypothetical protein